MVAVQKITSVAYLRRMKYLWMMVEEVVMVEVLVKRESLRHMYPLQLLPSCKCK